MDAIHRSGPDGSGPDVTTPQKSTMMKLRQSIMSGTYDDGTEYDYTTSTTPYLYSAAIDASTFATGIGDNDGLFGN